LPLKLVDSFLTLVQMSESLSPCLGAILQSLVLFVVGVTGQNSILKRRYGVPYDLAKKKWCKQLKLFCMHMIFGVWM